MKPEFYSVPLDVFCLQNKNEIWPLRQGCECMKEKSENNHHGINNDKSKEINKDVIDINYDNNMNYDSNIKSQINDINSNNNIDIMSVKNGLLESSYNSINNGKTDINRERDINGYNLDNIVNNDDDDLDDSLIWKRSDFVLK